MYQHMIVEFTHDSRVVLFCLLETQNHNSVQNTTQEIMSLLGEWHVHSKRHWEPRKSQHVTSWWEALLHLTLFIHESGQLIHHLQLHISVVQIIHLRNTVLSRCLFGQNFATWEKDSAGGLQVVHNFKWNCLEPDCFIIYNFNLQFPNNS